MRHPKVTQAGQFLAEARFYFCADGAHIGSSSRFCFYLAHNLAHVTDAFSASVGNGVVDYFVDFCVAQLLRKVGIEDGNLGNNILPRIPLIQRVFDHPALVGALTSLLGPDYTMNPHRHCHLNPPGSPGQSWHKDCYVFDHNFRHPRFHWLLALYYPQDVSEAMGPTGTLPGTQFIETIEVHTHFSMSY